jgi:hypothetical protein
MRREDVRIDVASVRLATEKFLIENEANR